MKQEEQVLETLTVAALAVAVIAACVKAFENAKQTGLPVMVEEHGALYEIFPGGQKRFVRQLPPRPRNDIQQKFTLR